MIMWMAAWIACLPLSATHAADDLSRGPGVPSEDSEFYDQVVEHTFLTSRTELVLIERLTLARLLPDQTEPTTVRSFTEGKYFAGRLPPDLVRDFVGVNRESSRLEGRFRFGIRYRFISAGGTEKPEAASAPAVTAVRAMPVQASPVVDRLAFSRVGRTLRNDQVLVYAEHARPDGTGAGFLIWFHRNEREWRIAETEVLWVIREDQGEEESP
jgi:hypothetical protein